jgi:transposase
MANRIQVSLSQNIVELYNRGWKKLRIARKLEVDTKTVRRYIRLHTAKSLLPPAGNVSKSPLLPLGSDSKSLLPPAGDPATPAAPEESKSLLLPLGDLSAAAPNSLLPPTGSSGRESQCLPHKARIETALEAGLSAQRIYQDLVTEEAFRGGYDAVKRFVRQCRRSDPRRFQRFESPPGEEAQIDFGRGAPIVADGRRQKTWAFRIVLSNSRKAYSEAVLRQTTDAFIRCLENAFRHFGGVPRVLVPDNLRAAVTRADWFEPELNPKVREFCQHYGTVMLPARPYRPRDKGMVENAIKYLKNNALKGRQFDSLTEQNRFLLDWESRVADLRIHGTTRQQVALLFERERPALLPLPQGLFPCFQEGRRMVHRDGFAEVERAYYEAPEEYLHRPVWVRWDGRTVRFYNDRMEQVAVHAKGAPGQFMRLDPSVRPSRLPGQEHGWLVSNALKVGPRCGAWAQAVLVNRGVEGIRPLYGLRQLVRQHGGTELERACGQALELGQFRLRDLRSLLERAQPEEAPAFIEAHPLIRDMMEYGSLFQRLVEEEPFKRKEDHEPVAEENPETTTAVGPGGHA